MRLTAPAGALRIQPAMQAFQFAVAFHAPEFALRFVQTRRRPAQDLLPGRQSSTRPVTSSTVEKQESMGLVVAKLRRSSGPTPSRCIVSVPSSPSSRLRAALGLMRSSCRKSFSNSALASA